jgi:hypothetical protein
MSFELRHKLHEVAGRVRSLRLSTVLAFCWLIWAAIGMLVFELARRGGWNLSIDWREIVVLAAASAIACVFAISRTMRDQRTVARRIEASHPELGTLLLAAVEQNSLPRGELGFLQTRVIRDAVEHSRRHNWNTAVSAWRLRLARFANLAALTLLVGVCIALANRGGAKAGSGSLQNRGLVAGSVFEIEVDPGDCEIERGTSLVVVAQFNGAVPPDAALVVEQDGSERQALPMSRSLEDPKFVGRVPTVEDDLSYHIEYAGRRSDVFRAKVFEYPELVRADAALEFPEYTSLESTVVEDVRQVTAVEGSKLTLVLHLNKEVAEARLDGGEANEITLARDDKEPAVYRASWTLTESRRLKLHLVDSAGRGNRLPAEIVVNVTPNRPPKIAIDRPARDVEVSPLEELQLAATVSDDFGVARAGVSYSHGGGEAREVTLQDSKTANVAEAGMAVGVAAKPQAAGREVGAEYLLDFEALNAEPDQLVSYFIWAEDIGPDGKLRRTESDMYFAEVRPFEEIFRQGEQPTENQQRQQQQQPGQGGNQQEATELADLQKEIINATWKLVRRETRDTPTEEFPKDAQLLEESQQSAIERLSALAERLEDSESLAHLQTARSHMDEALKQLSTAAGGEIAGPLRPALSAEQAAFQALLKLRAREFQVVRGNQQQQQGAASASRNSRSQRQLDQLELSADENRYETQTRATNPEETQAQRESRDILNRLRELARRQEDINERLRELQSALEQAQTEREREELQRELKRLRDQQQEILRDTDEMIARVDQQGNQQQAQENREQLEEARSRIQQASEALGEGQLSQAVNEGTRAGRQLSELRDQFRQQAANRFSEEMTEMRRSARELDERQQQLSQQLNQRNTGPGRSLRDSGSRGEVGEGLAEQRQELQNLMERMRQTIEEAEEPEPLLSKQLYDTVREAHQQRVENALDVARRLVEVGIEQEAGQAMQLADQGISNVRRGVEQAAESVLGDEAEALRRAQSEVERLAEELNREISQARGEEESDAPGAERDSERQDRERRGQSGASQEGQNQNQAGDRRAGERQAGENPNPRGEQQNGDAGNRGQRGEQPDQNEGQGEGQQVGQFGERGGRGSSDSEQENQESQQDQSEESQQQEGGQRGAGSRSGSGQGGRENEPRNEQAREGQGEEDGGERNRERGNLDGQNNGQNRERSSLRDGNGGRDADREGGIERFLNPGGPGGGEEYRGPITGENFREWADRLRDVEEMLDDAELRNDAARIRDRAEDARQDFRKHAKEPDWTKLQDLVADPLVELSHRIDEAIQRLESPDALVPIDRDPVPPEFVEQVRRYYERLGSGE